MSVFRSNSAVGLGVTEFGDPSELLRIAVYRQGARLVSALEMLTPQARGLKVHCLLAFAERGVGYNWAAGTNLRLAARLSRTIVIGGNPQTACVRFSPSAVWD